MKQQPASTELLDRMPPQNLDAERSVIGSLLLDSRKCDDVALILSADDFYADANRRLYRHLQAMHAAGREIDTTLLVDRLKHEGDFEAIGGGAYLAEIINSVAVAAHAVHYAKIVRERAIQREIIHCGTDLIREGYGAGRDVAESLDRCERRLFAVRDRQVRDHATPMADVLMAAMEDIDARMGGVASGTSTGFPDLDAALGGLHDGELIILAARPSMGKSALAVNIADRITEAGHGCLFCSLEMSQLEIGGRLLCASAGVSSHRFRNGWLGDDERERLVEASAKISQAPLMIDDSPTRTLSDVSAVARRLARKQDLRLIILDYLQLLTPADAREPRQEQVARISRQLKGLAREMSLPVLCLAQLNRQAEATKDYRPRLSHLRESGAIEQDADVVLFIHREEYYRPDNQDLKGKAELIIAKQRNGPTGEVPLVWRGDFMRFESAAIQEDEGTF